MNTQTATAPMTFEALLDHHQELVKQMKLLAAQEMKLRKELVAAAFPGDNSEGTHTYEMADGRVLKYTQPYTRSVDTAVLQAVVEELHKQGVDTSRLFAWKPSLSVKEYKALPENARRIADIAVTTKPGAPSLKVV